MNRTKSLLAALAIVPMMLLAACENKVTAENYAKIKNGMDLASVEHILGGAGEKQDDQGMSISATGMAGSSRSSRTTFIWKQDGAEISVSFENGKVVSTGKAGI